MPTAPDIDECYRILELRPNASMEQVKQAWRELVKVWHPDRFSNDVNLQRKAQERLKRINGAYDILERHLNSEATPQPEIKPQSEFSSCPEQGSGLFELNKASMRLRAVTSIVFFTVILIILLPFILDAVKGPQKSVSVSNPHSEVIPAKPNSVSASPAAAQTKPTSSYGHLTPYQRDWVVQQSGYDSNYYTVNDDGFIVEKARQPSEPAKPTTLPEDIRYMIRHNGTIYYSKDEPKPVGSGFKFKVYGRNLELTLSGNVEIWKIPKSNN